jgi:hypothetical protein
MADQEQINQIAAQLQPKYASYLRDPSKKGNLSAAERRVLDAVRSNPSPGQLESLYQFTKSSGTDFMVREKAFGFLATALGMPAQESRSLWQRLNRMTPLTGPGRRTPEEPAPPPEVSTQRVPGEGSAQGGEPSGVGGTVSRSDYVDAVLNYMSQDFVDWYRGDTNALNVTDRAKLSVAMRDPNNIDFRVLSEFSSLPADRFLDVIGPTVGEITQTKIQAGETVEESVQRISEQVDAYYDPKLSSVVYLTRDEARSRNLVRASQEQVRTAPVVQAETILSPAEIDRRTGVGYTTTAGDRETTRLGGTTRDGVTGGGEGVGGGMVPGAEPVDTGVPTDWETAAAEMYPEYYAIVRNQPEIAELLKRYINEGWSETKFQAELRGTNWWKTTTASAREWDTASALDPASYQSQVDEQATLISTQALNLGIRLSDERAQKLALDSLRLGWGPQTILNSIGMAATEAGSVGATQLREGFYGQQVRQIARQYGVTLADQTFNSFVNRIAVGDETMESFQDYALTIAKSLYPSITDQLDAGRTFDDIVAPFREIAASTLEMNPDEIDFTDPKWVTPITYQPDPKTGEQRLMSLAEWGKELRTNTAYGYEYTDQAKQQAYRVTEQLANLFGRV